MNWLKSKTQRRLELVEYEVKLLREEMARMRDWNHEREDMRRRLERYVKQLASSMERAFESHRQALIRLVNKDKRKSPDEEPWPDDELTRVTKP